MEGSIRRLMADFGLASIDSRIFQEPSDVLRVTHNAVSNDSWASAYFGNGPRKICSRHSAYLAFHIEYWSATHACEARILHDVAIVCSTVNHRQCGIDDKGGLPVAPYVPDE